MKEVCRTTAIMTVSHTMSTPSLRATGVIRGTTMNAISKKREIDASKYLVARKPQISVFDSRSPKAELFEQLRQNRLMFRPNSPSVQTRVAGDKSAKSQLVAPQKQQQEESVKLRESTTRLMNSDDGTVGSLQ